jgi:Protein of unknown function (DUF2917)
MNHTAKSAILHLSTGQLCACHPRAAGQLRVVAGRAWVTRHGDLDDHFIGPGEVLDLPAARPVLVGAETDLRWVIEPVSRPPAVRAAVWQRLCLAARRAWSSLHVDAARAGWVSGAARQSPRRS